MEEKVIKNEIVLFENQEVKLEVNMKDETVWLNVNQMSELFGRDSKTIRKHIDNALREELEPVRISDRFKKKVKETLLEIYHFIILI